MDIEDKKKYQITDEEKIRRAEQLKKAREKLQEIRAKSLTVKEEKPKDVPIKNETENSKPIEQKGVNNLKPIEEQKYAAEPVKEIPKIKNHFPNLSNALKDDYYRPQKQKIHKKISIKYYGEPSKYELENDEKILEKNFREDNDLEYKKSIPIKENNNNIEIEKINKLSKLLLGR